MAVADSLYESGKYPYALFLGHLALEKTLKAMVVKTTGKHAPYTHSLTLLASEASIKIPQKTMKKLAGFMEFHFEARYPDEQKKFYQRCTKAFAKEKLLEIREIFIWLTEKLQKK
jgi:HEPN domain-containing protein